MKKVLINVHGKAMENARHRVDLRLVSNKKDYLKWTLKVSCTSQKIFENWGNDLVVIQKRWIKT